MVTILSLLPAVKQNENKKLLCSTHNMCISKQLLFPISVVFVLVQKLVVVANTEMRTLQFEVRVAKKCFISNKSHSLEHSSSVSTVGT